LAESRAETRRLAKRYSDNGFPCGTTSTEPRAWLSIERAAPASAMRPTSPAG
jgi:hypothetical protein